MRLHALKAADIPIVLTPAAVALGLWARLGFLRGGRRAVVSARRAVIDRDGGLLGVGDGLAGPAVGAGASFPVWDGAEVDVALSPRAYRGRANIP